MGTVYAWKACAVGAVLCVVLGLASPASAEEVPAPMPSYVSPVQPMRAVALFDPPSERWLAGHRGVDVAASVGSPVAAPADGVVTFAGTVVNRGVVTVLHPNGLRTSVEPVEPGVTQGDAVSRGQSIGVVQGVPEEVSHCGAQACVHWGLRRGEEYLNPLDWLSGYGPVRLLPLDIAVMRGG